MTEPTNDILDLNQFILKIKRNWFYFLLSFLICFVAAFGFNRYSEEKYLVETSLLIKQDNNIGSASDLLYEKSILADNVEVSDKILLLKSYPLIYATLEQLRYDITFYLIGSVKNAEIYEVPIQIICDKEHNLYNQTLKFTNITFKDFSVENLKTGEIKTFKYNQKFEINNTSLKVIFNQNNFNQGDEYLVKFKYLKKLTKKYQNELIINQEERESSVVNISLYTTDQIKGIVFLNKLTENYIQSEVKEKSLASKNTVVFINNQLSEMQDSLSFIEQQIQDYKNKNNITDLSLKAQTIYSKIASVESELVKSRSINNYYDYLEKYISEGQLFEGISVPTSYGIDDPAINMLIDQLVEIQIKKNILIDGGQINNPAIAQYNRQNKQLLLNLQEAINTNRFANDILIKDIEQRIVKLESSLSSIPEVERELLSIERLQAISEKVYTFLLTKRAEAKISHSSITADSKVLEPAIYLNNPPDYPKKSSNYLFAFVMAIFIPLLCILLIELLNDKIISSIDIKRRTDIPIISGLGKNYSGSSLLFDQNPKSLVFEGFRGLRTNLDFIELNQKNKTIMVTSSTSGEGKTYISENLAIAYAVSNKRTIVIGADLRRPRLYKDFNKHAKYGISNYLENSKIKIEDIILKSEDKNLDLIYSGYKPERPAELFASDRFLELIDKLKLLYDIIIIDTPPVGLVADALIISKSVDINLFVVRHKVSSKASLNFINELEKNNKFKNINIVFNDVTSSDENHYGYGYGYGYVYHSKSATSNYFSDEKV